MIVSKKQETPWVVVIFVSFFSDGYQNYIKKLIKEMELSGTYANEVILVTETIIIKNNQVSFSNSFKKLKLLTSSPDTFTFVDFKEIPFDFLEGKNWEPFLTWLDLKYSSHKIIMAIISHGAGFGLFHNESNQGKRVRIIKSKNLVVPDRYQKIFNDFPGIDKKELVSSKSTVIPEKYFQLPNDSSCKNIEVLWITELAAAFKNGLQKRKIEILLMVNCYTQTFETGWLLRNNVKYLVAPETIFEIFGYSLGGILTSLNKNSNITTEALVDTIIPEFKSKWNANSQFASLLKRTTVSITEAHYYPPLKTCFEKIVAILANATDNQVAQIINDREKLIRSVTDDVNARGTDSAKIELVDLEYFFRVAAVAFPPDSQIHPLINAFDVLLRKCVIHFYVGPDFIDYDSSPQNTKKYRMSGISIYVPSVETRVGMPYPNCAYFGKQVVSSRNSDSIPLYNFTKHSLWDEFIKRYLLLM